MPKYKSIDEVDLSVSVDELRKGMTDAITRMRNQIKRDPDNAEKYIANYRKHIKGWSEAFPEQFAVIQSENTDKKIERLNQVDFRDDTVPADKTIKEAARNLGVMYGAENVRAVDGNQGFTIPSIENTTWIAGDAPESVNLHEGSHQLVDHTIGTGVRGIPNELGIRGLDFIRGIMEGNDSLVQETRDYYEGRYTDNQLTQVGIATLNKLYDDLGAAKDTEEYNKVIAKLDDENTGFLARLVSAIEPATKATLDTIGDVNGINPDRLKEIATLLQYDSGVEYNKPNAYEPEVVVNLNRTGFESTIK